MAALTDAQEKRLKDLEANTTRTPAEEAVRVALLELDEKAEDKDDADQALKDAIIAAGVPTVPQTVVDAQKAVDEAATAEDTAQKAVDDAEQALKDANPVV